jgi:hypothetical protein
MTRTGKTFVALGLLSPLAVVVVLGGGIVCPQWMSNERNASATLKTFASAQADFRSNDRDGDGVKQVWRGDVAGLYTLRPKGSDEAIKLIERSAAMADLRLATAPPADWEVAPKAGYWFAALRFEDEAPGKLAPDRFAFVAAPDTLKAGKTVFAITQAGAVWRRPARGGVGDLPTAFPLDPAAAGWTTGW